MSVQYNSKKIIPAPLVNISQEYIKNGDTKIGTIYRITLTGTMLSNKGSPQSDGTFWTLSGYPADETITHDTSLKSILAKQAAIRQLFSEEGKSFEIQPLDGSAPLKCNPRVVSVDVPEGQWFNTAPYTVVLEADIIYGLNTTAGEVVFDEYLVDAKEEWSIETDKFGFDGAYAYKITHSISAVGKKHYLSNGSSISAYESARAWVQARIIRDATFGITQSPPYWESPAIGGSQVYTALRTSNVDEIAGSYSVTEAFLITNACYLEECNIDTNISIDDPITKVIINGTIEGLEKRQIDDTIDETKYNNAVIGWATVSAALLTRCQTYSGLTLNPIPYSYTVGRNPLTGIITYNYTYDTRPTNLVSGSLSENITVTDKNPTDVFASLPVLGRTAGPVLQDMSTVTQRERTLNIDVKVTPSTNLLTGKPDVDSIITTVKPSEGDVYKSADDETWNARMGSYNRTVSWTWVKDA